MLSLIGLILFAIISALLNSSILNTIVSSVHIVAIVLLYNYMPDIYDMLMPYLYGLILLNIFVAIFMIFRGQSCHMR